MVYVEVGYFQNDTRNHREGKEMRKSNNRFFNKWVIAMELILQGTL